MSADQKVLTVKLRRGIRWSDGEPFTTEDVRFFWEDVRLNEELTPKLGGRYNPGGESGLSHAKKSRAVTPVSSQPYRFCDVHLVRYPHRGLHATTSVSVRSARGSLWARCLKKVEKIAGYGPEGVDMVLGA